MPAGTINKDEFYADVMEVLKGSPVAALLTQGLHFSIHDFSGDIAEIKALASAIVASVEIIKANLAAQYPGQSFGNEAIECAGKILADSIVLPGVWGKIEHVLLGPILRGFLEGALGAFKLMAANKDWLALARAALALTV